MAQQYDKFVKYVQILSIPVIIFFISFLLVFLNYSFYESHITHARGMELTNALFEYFFSANNVINFEGLNERERSHLADVRRVLLASFFVFLMVLFLFLLSFVFVKYERYVFFYGGLIMIAICILIPIVPFEILFNKFHELFFATDSWIFPYDNLLVSVYTMKFFEAFFTRIVLQALIISFAIIILSVFVARFKKQG